MALAKPRRQGSSSCGRMCCRCVDQLRQLTTFDVTWNGQSVPTSAWCGVVEGLPVYMLEPQQQAAFFWRGRFYGEVRAE